MELSKILKRSTGRCFLKQIWKLSTKIENLKRQKKYNKKLKTAILKNFKQKICKFNKNLLRIVKIYMCESDLISKIWF